MAIIISRQKLLIVLFLFLLLNFTFRTRIVEALFNFDCSSGVVHVRAPQEFLYNLLYSKFLYLQYQAPGSALHGEGTKGVCTS